MIEIRTCVACKHFLLDLGEEGWSEFTPGGPGNVECLRGHWRLYESDFDMDDFRACIRKGLTCDDFDRHEAFKGGDES